MNNQKNIGAVFSVIIFLLIGLGASSLFYLTTIAKEAENLYRHPYAVSNASRNININLISMHRYMKDVVYAENGYQLRAAKDLVNKYEQQAQKNFDVIFERYLGKQQDIQTVYNGFLEWKQIRDEVVFLKAQGKDQQALEISKNKEAKHVAMLTKQTEKLVHFADNQAKLFFERAVEAKNHAITVIVSLFIITVLSSVFITYYTLRRLHKAQHDIKSRMHLIDQNILMAKFDLKGVVIDISNKLCRFLGITKHEIIGKKAHFFITDKKGEVQPEEILATASTGTSWEGELYIEDNHGLSKWIHSAVHPELNEEYEVSGYSNIIQDISDRKAIEELSITDPLTKLHNRRYFDQTIDKELRLATRNKTPLTLAIIDVDYFKKYNDYYGHPAGDQVLVRIAQLFSQSLQRPNDYVFRLGGEEFGFIFSGFCAKQALPFLETIKTKIEQLKIEHIKSDVSPYVTISIGAYLSCNENQLDSKQLYIKADEALYKAKCQRNTVFIPN